MRTTRLINHLAHIRVVCGEAITRLERGEPIGNRMWALLHEVAAEASEARLTLVRKVAS